MRQDSTSLEARGTQLAASSSASTTSTGGEEAALEVPASAMLACIAPKDCVHEVRSQQAQECFEAVIGIRIQVTAHELPPVYPSHTHRSHSFGKVGGWHELGKVAGQHSSLMQQGQPRADQCCGRGSQGGQLTAVKELQGEQESER